MRFHCNSKLTQIIVCVAFRTVIILKIFLQFNQTWVRVELDLVDDIWIWSFLKGVVKTIFFINLGTLFFIYSISFFKEFSLFVIFHTTKISMKTTKLLYKITQATFLMQKPPGLSPCCDVLTLKQICFH